MEPGGVQHVGDVIEHIHNTTSETVEFIKEVTGNSTLSSIVEELSSYNFDRPIGEYVSIAGFVLTLGLWIFYTIKDWKEKRRPKQKKIE
jgi:hypothetical protein